MRRSGWVTVVTQGISEKNDVSNWDTHAIPIRAFGVSFRAESERVIRMYMERESAQETWICVRYSM